MPVAASTCSSCGGVVPGGYAFCPTCGAPVAPPAAIVPPPVTAGRLVFLFGNALLLVIFTALALLSVVAPPTAGAGPTAATATLPPATAQVTVETQTTPTLTSTAARTSPTATPTHHAGPPPTATLVPTQPAPTATATVVSTPPTATPTYPIGWIANALTQLTTRGLACGDCARLFVWKRHATMWSRLSPKNALSATTGRST